MEKLTYIASLQEPNHKNPLKLNKIINGYSSKEKPSTKKSTQLPLIQKNENIELSNIPIKTLKLEILNINDIRSPAKKVESSGQMKKSRNNNNLEKVISQIPNKTIQKVPINYKETQKKIEKRNEEMENSLKNLVTVKREALIQRNQIRHNSNKIDAKLLKTITLKKKIPEICHNYNTKKIINLQAETINFKDIFYLEPLENKLSQKLFKKESDPFEETIKNENNKKLAIVNHKFRKILTKIQKKEFPNCFNHVLLANHHDFQLQSECSSKSVEISTKDINFLLEEIKKDNNIIVEKERIKKRSSSFSYPFDFNKKSNDENIFSLKCFASTQSQISKSVSRESLIENNRKKTDEFKKKLCEIPFIINFPSEEVIKPVNEIKGNVFKWKEEMIIGSGTCGRVIKALDVETGRLMAVKKIDTLSAYGNDRASISEIEDEMMILKALHHKNIIELYGFEKIDNSLFLYLEYMSLGNICNILKNQGPFEESLIRSYSKQILEGLKYLHNQRIIHKDLKGANILLNEENVIKLGDFGSAQKLERTLTMSLRPGNKNLSIYGSIPWMAPEVIRQTKYGRKADIWSFGCTILEMAQGKAPWSEQKFDNPIAAIMKIGLSDEIPNIPETISGSLKDFILCCLKRDANMRPHAKDLLNHEFLANVL